MIKKRNVLRMKVPYPSVSDGLAVSAHMYICQDVREPKYFFVKCQTLKPYMLINNTMRHYCDEMPDINRNPFQKVTRIDCDKLFSTSSVTYDDKLKTDVREDVCEDLFCSVLKELELDGYEKIPINEKELVRLNPMIFKRDEKIAG